MTALPQFPARLSSPFNVSIDAHSHAINWQKSHSSHILSPLARSTKRPKNNNSKRPSANSVNPSTSTLVTPTVVSPASRVVDPLVDPGNSLATAEIQTSGSFQRSQQVSATDLDDFFQFSFSQSGIFTADLAGLTGDADVRLVRDRNNNGAIDANEIMAWQWERGITNESLRCFLSAGNYFLQVTSYNNQTADYTLTTQHTPATADDRAFKTRVQFDGKGKSLSAPIRKAIREAARFWENVISFSSFNGSQTLPIRVSTVNQGGNRSRALASAFPTKVATDAAGRVMPTAGTVTVNIDPKALSYSTANLDRFRRIMIHELGHILGLGSFWGTESYGRNLVNRSTATYSASTYAGTVYGELLGTYVPTAIPVASGVGAGSDFMHWSEGVFDNELMTPITGGQRSGMPLSAITIAALRDIGWNVNFGAAETFSLFK